MTAQARLEQRLKGVHKAAGVIVTVLGNVQARTPGTFPESLDDMHKAIKRGELRRILKSAQDIVAEVERPFPTEDEGLSSEQLARRAARREENIAFRAKKKPAKKKATKKKSGGG